MADGKDTGDKTLQGPAKTLSLKRTVTDTGTVKQSFSHGRTKQVVVEKKRTLGGRPATPPPPPERPQPKVAAQPEKPAATPAPDVAKAAPQRTGMVLRTLTDAEKDARARAIAENRVAEFEARKRAEEDARRRSEEDERLRVEREAAAKRKAEEDARRASEDEVKRRAEVEATRRLETDERAAASAPAGARAPSAPGRPGAAPAPRKSLEQIADEEESARKRGVLAGKIPPKKPAPAPARQPDNRMRGKLTVTKALDDSERVRSVASFRRQTARHHRQASGPQAQQVMLREVTIPEAIAVGELANRMARRSVELIKILMKNGMMVTINDTIDADTAQLVAEELGHTVKRVAESDVLEGLAGAADEAGELQPRPPVVTIMGHVDHGKTSLLDSLRATDVAAGEAGGITQHIGAYQVQLESGQRITFLDTPGHAAFTAMRARGAKVTDIVVLVVAADDGVMPQTVEAISHAKAAKVPIIVAINKVDKPDANPNRVKTELLQYEIQVEDMGGEVQAVEVSALKKIGLDKLAEAILLQSELLELKANPDRPADGAVVEAKLDKGRGPVATVLVQRGTLKVGDTVVAGSEWGRVRALTNERGEQVKIAGPATPVEILGLQGVPEAGDEFVVVENDSRAREVTEYRARKRREVRASAVARTSLDQLVKAQKEGEKKLLPLVVKADVQGSVEAIAGALEKLGTGEVGVQILMSGVGGITESDVILAQASDAAILGFNVRANAQARERAKRDGVDIRYYNIIYNVIDDVKAALTGLLAPTYKETFLGNAEILEVFAITKVGKVAGCRVTEGSVRRGAKVRLIRDNVVIHEGKLSTLKRFKDEVKEVPVGQECGMAFENYQDIQKGDVIECFDVEQVQRSL